MDAFKGRNLIVVGAQASKRPRLLARRGGRGQARAPTGNVFFQMPTPERPMSVLIFFFGLYNDRIVGTEQTGGARHRVGARHDPYRACLSVEGLLPSGQAQGSVPTLRIIRFSSVSQGKP